jgi:hypothetical protein
MNGKETVEKKSKEGILVFKCIWGVWKRLYKYKYLWFDLERNLHEKGYQKEKQKMQSLLPCLSK